MRDAPTCDGVTGVVGGRSSACSGTKTRSSTAELPAAAAAAAAHGVCCCCESHRMMTPRAALNRMWLTLRCLLIATAVPPIAYVICATLAADDFGHDTAGTGGLIIYAISFALAGLTFKPANRGRIRRFLGSLGAKGTSEQEAAAIAALVGGRSPAETLSLATSKFRMLTTDQLLELRL